MSAPRLSWRRCPGLSYLWEAEVAGLRLRVTPLGDVERPNWHVPQIGDGPDAIRGKPVLGTEPVEVAQLAAEALAIRVLELRRRAHANAIAFLEGKSAAPEG